MNALILQLSDLHLKNAQNPVLNRTKQIVSAIKHLHYEIDLCAIVFSGDLAFSGEDSQYEVIDKFIAEITDGIKSSFQPNEVSIDSRIPIVVVPGNHDCLFDEDEVRTSLLTTVSQKQGVVTDATLDILLRPQRNFFQFLSNVTSPAIDVSTAKSKLVWTQVIEKNGIQIRFISVNSSWCSQKTEQQGSLYFPQEIIPVADRSNAITIGVFHHPYNWFHATESTRFRARIESTCDYIITGHEHNPDWREVSADNLSVNYLEGCALYDGEEGKSEFHAILLDLKARKQKLWKMQWKENIYSPVAMLPEWSDYHITATHEGRLIRVKGSFKDEVLLDTGMELTHRKVGRLILSQIYVYPDMDFISDDPMSHKRMTKSEHVQKMLRDTDYVLVTGDELSGKTALARRAFSMFLEEGLIPVLVEGGTHLALGEALHKELDKNFKSQYDYDRIEDWNQIDKNKRVIIIDNYNKIRYNADFRMKFIKSLCQYSGKVILIADSLSLTLGDLKGTIDLSASSSVEFKHYEIRGFSSRRREQLVSKWTNLGFGDGVDAEDLARRANAVNGTLNTLIGRNFVPSLPVYILTVLQAEESLSPVDLGASAQGYFYELLIRTELTKEFDASLFHLVTNFLSHVANSMHMSGTLAISELELRQIQAEYESKYEVVSDWPDIVRKLQKIRIFWNKSGIYSFRYDFIYYYYVASYMKQTTDGEAIDNLLAKMAREIYVTENANILMFLAHIEKRSKLIEILIRSADSLYSDQAVLMIEDDVKFLLDLDDWSEALELPALEESGACKIIHEDLDAAGSIEDLDHLDAYEPESLDEDPMRDLNAALKTIQVLGQFLKNFGGGMEKDLKGRIVIACYKLGMRAGSHFCQMVESNNAALIKLFAETIRLHNPTFDDETLVRKAAESLSGLSQYVLYGLVRRVSIAVGAPRLMPTFERIDGELSGPSFDLIFTSLQLDHAENFPEEVVRRKCLKLKANRVAFSILRRMVFDHMVLFNVNYKRRQKLCAELQLVLPHVLHQRADKKLV